MPELTHQGHRELGLKSEKEPLISLSHVEFGYPENLVLNDMSFDIHQGDYIGILGPNGSGKTTLLKIVLGILQPSTGSISYKKGIRIGYVPQHVSWPDFHFPASAEEVVRTGLTADAGIFHRPTRAQLQQVDHALEQVGITHLKNKLIAHISGGERQRVFIARALAARPSILVLDEPTTGIDIASQEQFYGILEELNQKENLTIALVSHDIDLVSSEINRVILMNRKIIFDGKPDALLTEEHLSELYGKHITLLAHRHKQQEQGGTQS